VDHESREAFPDVPAFDGHGAFLAEAPLPGARHVL